MLVCAVGVLCGALAAPAGAAKTCPGDEDDQDPAPYMTVTAPASVTAGESFTLEVEGWNYGAPGDKYSTISVSAPQLDGPNDEERARVVSDTFAYTTIKNAGETVWDDEGNAQVADYLLVEGGTLADDSWCEAGQRSLTAEFTPRESGTFTLYVRTTVDMDGETVTYPYPGNHDGTTDQQGFRVKTVDVNVEPKAEINATITNTEFESEDYERGDTVEGSVTVENTGDRRHTYYVGYSLYDPFGKVYNSDAATTVTLSQGESQSLGLDWEVPEGVRAGAYDPRVSVWQESNPNDLDNRVADFRGEGNITVREEPSIDANITETDIDDGEYRDDEGVDASVQVENTGNREHTYFVGYSVTGPDGAVYDIPGETVTLAPGSTEWVDLEWEIPADVDAGAYDARVSVWKESDPTNLWTRLADVDRDDHFEVRPQETVVFTVSKAASMEGFEVEGEPISGATIEMRGYDYTADEDGEVRVEFPVDNYAYTVSAEGYESESGTLRMTANSGTQYEYIALEREGVETLTVDVVNGTGEPLAANTYDITVDGDQVTPDARGQVRLETGEHTVAAIPTGFGETKGVERVEKQVTVDDDGASVRLTAIPKGYTLAVDMPETGGGVSVADNDRQATDVAAQYDAGTQVTVTAEPAVGHTFDHWEGDYPESQQTSETLLLSMDENIEVTPVFERVDGDMTVVAYNPEQERFNNYTVSRTADMSFDSARASPPEGSTWADVSPPPSEYSNKRTDVSPADEYPWSAVGQIQYGWSGTCTATVIEGNHILTAGHCVYEDGEWKDLENIQFFPGRDGSDLPFYSQQSTGFEVKYVQTYQKWVDSQNRAYDIAVLTIDRDIGAETGTFGYEGRPALDQLYTSDDLHLTGYPSGDAFYVETINNQWDLIAEGQGTGIIAEPECWGNNMCLQVATGSGVDELIYGGYSGGPVWHSDESGRPAVISVFAAGPKGLGKEIADPIKDGVAVRISTARFNTIGQMVRNGNQVNVPPDVTATATPNPTRVNEEVTFDASKTVDTDGEVVTYAWDFDEDGVAEQSTSSPKVTYAYTTAGEFAVNVTAMDDDGDTASAEVPVTVEQRQQGSLEALNITAGSISKCGQLCRDVSYTVINPTDEAVTDLQVNATISSGGQTVWKGNRTFAKIPPGRTPVTATVDLDPSKALIVQENDGQVTVVLEVTAGGETRTFRFEREV